MAAKPFQLMSTPAPTGVGNPHFNLNQAQLATMVQALQTPQANQLAYDYQRASDQETQNMQAAQNMRGGWGEFAARMGAEFLLSRQRRDAAQGISSAFQAQQQGMRSADDAALGLGPVHPGANHAVTTPDGGSVPAMLSTGSTGNAMGAQDAAVTADDPYAAIKQALMLNPTAGPAQTSADLSSKFAQPSGQYADLAQALTASNASPPLPPVGSPEHAKAFSSAMGYASPTSPGDMDQHYARALSTLSDRSGASTPPQPTAGDLQMASLLAGQVGGQSTTPAAGTPPPASSAMLALPAPSTANSMGQPPAPADPFGAGGAISTAPGPQAGSVDPSDPHGRAFNYFTAHGYSPAAAAGIVGGFNAESQMNPGAYNPKENAVGLGQWRGPRLAALQSFARTQGTSPQDFDTQLAFTVHELGGPEGHAAGLLRGASDPMSGAAAMNAYLRPQGYVPGGDPRAVSNWHGRSGAAMQAASMYGGQGQDSLQGGQPPSMAQGQGSAPMPAPGSPMQPPPPADPFSGGQPSAPPQPSQALPTNYNAPTQAQLTLYQRWANSPYPQERQQAHELAMRLQEQQAGAPAWEAHVDPTTGRTLYVDKSNPGATPVQIGAPQGFVGPAPTNMDYNPQTGGYDPKRGTMESAPRQVSPSAFATQDPFGRYTVTNVPGKAGEAPAGKVWNPQSQSYEFMGGAAPQTFGAYQPNTVVTIGADGKPTVTQAPSYTASSALDQRNKFYDSKDYELHAKTVNAVNSLQDMLTKATGNDGLLSMSALDNLLQAQTGLSARVGGMQLQLSHLGVPQEIQGAMDNLLGKGPVTPETVGRALSILRSYGQTHEATLQNRLDSENAFAKRNGFDLGITIPHMNAAPDVPWMRAAPPPPAPAPGSGGGNPMRGGGGQVAAAPAPAQRQAGAVYNTPRGPMRWTGTGWAR